MVGLLLTSPFPFDVMLRSTFYENININTTTNFATSSDKMTKQYG